MGTHILTTCWEVETAANLQNSVYFTVWLNTKLYFTDLSHMYTGVRFHTVYTNNVRYYIPLNGHQGGTAVYNKSEAWAGVNAGVFLHQWS